MMIKCRIFSLFMVISMPGKANTYKFCLYDIRIPRRLHLHVELEYSWGDEQGKREVGDEGAEAGRWGVGREKRGREEGEEGEGMGRKLGKKGRDGKEENFARAALRREEGTMGREGEVRGREGERPSSCPSPHSRVAVSFNCTYSP